MQKPWEIARQHRERRGQADPYAIAGPAREPPPQTGAQSEKDITEAALARQRLAQEQATAEALRRRANAEAQKAEIEAGRLADTPMTDDQQKLKAKNANLDSLVGQINRVQELYEQSLMGQPASRLGGLSEYLPTPANSQFNAAAAGMAEQGLAAFRVPGVGSQSDAELRQFVQANKPSASNFDESIEEKLRQLRARVDATRQQMGLPPAQWQSAGQQNDVEPPAIGSSGQARPPSGGGMDRTSQVLASPGGGERVELAQGSQRTENDPALAGVNARINAMLKGGESIGRIAKYIESVGIPVREVYPQLMQIEQFRKKYPGYKGDYTVNIDDRMVPMSDARQLINNIGQSPLGAYAINAADSLSLGTLDNMTANPALTRAGMEGVRQQNPKSSFAGQVTGGALMAGGMELGAAAGLARMGAQRFAPMLGDAAFGAAYGAGSADEGSRLAGAAMGAGAAAGGGLLGRKAASGAGRALTGTRDAATRYLTERGVPLTVGQIAGKGGAVGRRVKRMEDALESVPLLGDAIRRRRTEGVQAFNRAAFSEALAPIGTNTAGQIAEEGVETARSSVSGAYDSALNGVRAKPDSIFVRDLTRAMAAGRRLHPDTAKDFGRLVQNEVAGELASGELTGEGYQTLRRIIREERSVWAGKPRGRQYGAALRNLEGALESLIRRQAPGVVEALNRADAAYRGTGVVRNAVSAGRNSGGVFTPAQLGTAAEANAKKFGGTNATTQRPFFDLQRAGQDILPSQLPNSGTADRIMASALLPALPGMVGGAGAATGMISPETAAIMAALGLPFTKAGQAAFQKMLVERPDAVRRAGEEVLRRKNLGGLLAAPVAATSVGPQ